MYHRHHHVLLRHPSIITQCDGVDISEKYFKALPAGVVPIVDGPSEYASEYMPTDKYAIHVNDFESVKELAEYLQKLNEDDELFMQHLSHKRGKPLKEDFLETITKASSPYSNSLRWCKLASMIHRGEPSQRYELDDNEACLPNKWAHLPNI